MWHRVKEFVLDADVRLQAVPITASGSATRVSDGVGELTSEERAKYQGRLNKPYLIFFQGNTEWSDHAYIALLIPSLEYVESGKSLESPNGLVPDGFDGLVILYALDGTPKYLYNYIDGYYKGAKGYRRRTEGGEASLLKWGGHWEERCYWITYGIEVPPTEDYPYWSGGVESKKICESYFVPEEIPDTPPIQKQKDYIEGVSGGGGGGMSFPSVFERLQNKKDAKQFAKEQNHKAKEKLKTQKEWLKKCRELYEQINGTREFGFADYGNGVYKELLPIADFPALDTRMHRDAIGIMHTHVVGSTFDIFSITDYGEFVSMVIKSLQNDSNKLPLDQRYLGLIDFEGHILLLRFVGDVYDKQHIDIRNKQFLDIYTACSNPEKRLKIELDLINMMKYRGHNYSKVFAEVIAKHLPLMGLMLQEIDLDNSVRTSVLYEKSGRYHVVTSGWE